MDRSLLPHEIKCHSGILAHHAKVSELGSPVSTVGDRMPFRTSHAGALSALQYKLLVRVCGDVVLLKQSDELDHDAIRALRDAVHAGPDAAFGILDAHGFPRVARLLSDAAGLLRGSGHDADATSADQAALLILGWKSRKAEQGGV